jgi:hypothetical protein
MIHTNGVSSINIFITPYMVPFCNRTLVFLPISGYRCRTGFRFKISTGGARRRRAYIGGSQGKIAEAKARPPSSNPGGHPAPIFADGICWRRQATTCKSSIASPSSNPGVIQNPYCEYATPRKVRSAAAHTITTHHLNTTHQQYSVSFQATTDNNNDQPHSTTLEYVI